MLLIGFNSFTYPFRTQSYPPEKGESNEIRAKRTAKVLLFSDLTKEKMKKMEKTSVFVRFFTQNCTFPERECLFLWSIGDSNPLP